LDLLLATIGGAVCGAILVGLAIAGIVWWQRQSSVQNLRTNLNQTMASPQPTPSAFNTPPPRYFSSQPTTQGPVSVEHQFPSEVPFSSPPAGVTQGTAWLDGVGGIVKGQRMILIKDETLLGRSGVCDLQFHDPKVSRQHALLRLYNSNYFIQDMQSSRGTYINGRRVETHELRDRDQIQIGDTILVFRRI
jgi:hypothetical protein